MVTLSGGVQQTSGNVPVTSGGSPIVPVSDSGFIQNFYGTPTTGGINTYYTPIQQTQNETYNANLTMNQAQLPGISPLAQPGPIQMPADSSGIATGFHGEPIQMPNLAALSPRGESTGRIQIGNRTYDPSQVTAQAATQPEQMYDGGGGGQYMPPQQQQGYQQPQYAQYPGVTPAGGSDGMQVPQAYSPYQNIRPVKISDPNIGRMQRVAHKLFDEHAQRVRDAAPGQNYAPIDPRQQANPFKRFAANFVAGSNPQQAQAYNYQQHARLQAYNQAEKEDREERKDAYQEMRRLAEGEARRVSSRAEKAWDLGFKVAKEIAGEGLTPNQSVNLQRHIMTLQGGIGSPGSGVGTERDNFLQSLLKNSHGRFDYSDMRDLPQTAAKAIDQALNQQRYDYYAGINSDRAALTKTKTKQAELNYNEDLKYKDMERATDLMRKGQIMKSEDTAFIDKQVTQANNIIRNYGFAAKQAADLQLIGQSPEEMAAWTPDKHRIYDHFVVLGNQLPAAQELIQTAQARRMETQYGADVYQPQIKKMVDTPAPGQRRIASPSQKGLVPPPPPYMAPMMGAVQDGGRMPQPQPMPMQQQEWDGTMYVPPPPMMTQQTPMLRQEMAQGFQGVGSQNLKPEMTPFQGVPYLERPAMKRGSLLHPGQPQQQPAPMQGPPMVRTMHPPVKREPFAEMYGLTQQQPAPMQGPQRDPFAEIYGLTPKAPPIPNRQPVKAPPPQVASGPSKEDVLREMMRRGLIR